MGGGGLAHRGTAGSMRLRAACMEGQLAACECVVLAQQDMDSAGSEAGEQGRGGAQRPAGGMRVTNRSSRKVATRSTTARRPPTGRARRPPPPPCPALQHWPAPRGARRPLLRPRAAAPGREGDPLRPHLRGLRQEATVVGGKGGWSGWVGGWGGGRVVGGHPAFQKLPASPSCFQCASAGMPCPRRLPFPPPSPLVPALPAG